jgi:hypothetical protein
MASCAVIDAQGVVHVDQSTAASDCSAFVLLSAADFSAIKQAAEPFDAGQAATLWGFAFSSVLLCWFVARGAGTILGLIRRG